MYFSFNTEPKGGRDRHSQREGAGMCRDAGAAGSPSVMGRTCPHSRSDPPACEEVSTFIAPRRVFFGEVLEEGGLMIFLSSPPTPPTPPSFSFLEEVETRLSEERAASSAAEGEGHGAALQLSHS